MANYEMILEVGFWLGVIAYNYLLLWVVAIYYGKETNQAMKFLRERKLLQSYADWKEAKRFKINWRWQK